MFDAAEKSLEKCTQGCGGKRTEHEYKNSTYDLQTYEVNDLNTVLLS